jgi:hypothetical protein
VATASQLSVPYFATPSRICLFRCAHPHGGDLAGAFLAFALADLAAAFFSVVAALIGILLVALTDVFEPDLADVFEGVVLFDELETVLVDVEAIEARVTLAFEAGSDLVFATVLAFGAGLIEISNEDVTGGSGAELVGGLGLNRGLAFAVFGAGLVDGFTFFLGRGTEGADLRGCTNGFSV